jgi:hypothetical protein
VADLLLASWQVVPNPANVSHCVPIFLTSLLGATGCNGSSASKSGSDAGDASLEKPDASEQLDGGDSSRSDAFTTPCGPCHDDDGGGMAQTVCGTDPCWVCYGQESDTYCVDGHWLICHHGGNGACFADAAPPEGTRCCKNDYIFAIGGHCQNCIGGHHLSCDSNGSRLKYLDTCSDVDASEASSGALLDASPDTMDSASE